MKRFLIIAAACATVICTAEPFEIGYSADAFASATRLTGAVAVSTNASQVVTVKAVYSFEGTATTVTNQLYSLTCSGGVATSTDAKIVGKGAAILVTGAPVEFTTN